MSLKTYCFNYVETVAAGGGGGCTIEFSRQLNKEISLIRFSYSYYLASIGGKFFHPNSLYLVTGTLRFSNGRLTDEIVPGRTAGAGTLQPFCFFYEPREYNFSNIPIFNNLQIQLTFVNGSANNTDFNFAGSFDLEETFKYN